MSIAQPNAPAIDTMLFAGHQALDIYLDGGKAYVASYHAGLQVLDVGNPAAPVYLGCYDTAGASRYVSSVAARDSFAFVSWPVPRMLSIDVTDATRPLRAGRCEGMFGPPEDMVVRDSLVYCAEGRRFQVVNVARPREPELVGSCNIQDGVWGLVVRDTLALVAGVSLYIVNVADPASPYVVSTSGKPSIGVAVRDTFAYVPSFETLFVYSVASPSQPRVLSTTPTGRAWDVVLGDSLLFIGTGAGVEAYDIGNPVGPRRVGFATAPYSNRRLCYAGGYLYAALWDAGVAVYETTAAGVGEGWAAVQVGPSRIRAVPNPAAGRVRLIGAAKAASVDVHDAVGRAVVVEATRTQGGDIELNVAGLEPGVYFVEVVENKKAEVLRIVRP